MTKIFHDFPAYDVADGEYCREWKSGGYGSILTLRAGDELALISAPMQHYQIGSVVSYSMKNGDCPIKALDRARSLGHDLHFIFALGSMIHNGPHTKGRYIGVEIGQKVLFEGRVFEIGSASNRNLKLIPVAV